MRIQHNIAAMNAYRNYNNNTSSLSKNLEKLSSGYKINRAGDDAAGLAISEKMRAQITGLNAAQKNVKDGISLVKTAEGAMQEIQDMLNRMDYLATQSANGTYQDEVDREALQKEVDQLQSEINRIADSANFNGIKLLDGTWDVDGKAKALEAAQAAVDAASGAAKADVVYGGTLTNEQIQDMMLELGGDGPNSADDVGDKTILETEKVEFQKPSYQVSFNGVTHTMTTDAANVGTGAAITLTVGGTDVTISETDIKDYLKDKLKMDEDDIKKGFVVDGETLAGVFAEKIKGASGTGKLNTTLADSYTDVDGSTVSSVDWDVRTDGEKVVFEFSNSNGRPKETLDVHMDAEIAGTAKTRVDAVGGHYTTGTYNVPASGAGAATTLSSDVEFSVTAKVGGKDVTFTGSVAASSAVASVNLVNMGTELGNAEAKIDGKTYKLSDFFAVTNNGSGFDITSLATGKEGSDQVTKVKIDIGDNMLATGKDKVLEKPDKETGGWTDGVDEYNTGTNGYINAGSIVTIAGTPADSEQLASTTLDMEDITITDGLKITLGNQSYTFAVGKDSKYAGAENVVDLTNLKDEDVEKLLDNDDDLKSLALTKLSEAAKDNDVFTVSHESGTNEIGLKQLAEAKEATDMTTMEKFASYISISTVDEAATAEAQAAAEAKQAEELAKAQEELAAAEANGAKALNLQIGDTGDDFNQLGVKIGSMKTTALGVDGLSISTAEDAKAAIDTIKDAINYVSSVRGDLGAYQNRLDHTANNLSVMAENITDAESTIRDTDVAEEMMSYVKNNILVQSAQAMLAQANQLPQGVLQLLG